MRDLINLFILIILFFVAKNNDKDKE